MTPLEALLQFLLPPVLVATALLAASFVAPARPADGSGEPAARPPLLGRLLPPAVLALAFWSGDIALNQWHPLWPRDGTSRYLAVAIGAACCAVVHAAARRPLFTALVRLALGAAITPALLAPLDERYMPRPLLISLTPITALWMAGVGAILDGASKKLPRFAVPGAIAATAALAAPGLFELGYAGGARLTGTLCAMAGGLFVASLIRARAGALHDGAHTVWLAILLAILLITYGYNEVPAWWPLPLMALAPLGLLVGLFPRPAWARVLGALAGPALIAGIATFGAAQAASVSPDAPYYAE